MFQTELGVPPGRGSPPGLLTCAGVPPPGEHDLTCLRFASEHTLPNASPLIHLKTWTSLWFQPFHHGAPVDPASLVGSSCFRCVCLSDKTPLTWFLSLQLLVFTRSNYSSLLVERQRDRLYYLHVNTTAGRNPSEEMEWSSWSTKESEMQYLDAISKMTE